MRYLRLCMALCIGGYERLVLIFAWLGYWIKGIQPLEAYMGVV
jgi:hypothetical protein